MGPTILAQAQLQDVLRKFKLEHGEEYRISALGYFGSYARNEATEESDVDIVFDTDAPNLFRTSAMRLKLEETLGRHVDVVRLREHMNPRLKARVEREAVYV
jgi:predicted nucleotidyltransferase